MKSSKSFAALLASLFILSATAQAGGVDMKDPRRAVGREDDIRVDAQLLDYNIGAGSPVAVTYQIENLTRSPIAVADRVTETSYDPDSQTIIVSVGAEIPNDKALPHLVTIAPGQKRVFRSGVSVHVVVPHSGPFTLAPRYVQMKVNVLRDISAFADVLAAQERSARPVAATPTLFDKWLDSNDSILLNSVPVQWSDRPQAGGVTAADYAPQIAAGGGM